MNEQELNDLRVKGARAAMQHMWFLGYTKRQLARITAGKVQLEVLTQ